MSAEPQASPEDTWEPPEVIPGYRVVARIGRGGMGKVYLAREVQLDRLVALKFLCAPAWVTTAPVRFLAEARALARLDHPNIVGVYRIDEVEGHPFIAYEYVRGESLERMLKPVRWQTALAISERVASALGAAHHAGLLHRDIKPGNVMISPAGKVKLLDFGLAIDAAAPPAPAFPQRAAREHGGLALSSGMRLTAPGLAVGTPRYWAPEQWHGLAATKATDVYAVGLLAYELIVGEAPHAHLAGFELSHALTVESVAPIDTDLAPSSFLDVIAKCLRREPADRYQTGAELAQALEAVQEASSHRRRVETAVGADADLVTASWSRVARESDVLAARFFALLFQRHPELPDLLPADPTALRSEAVRLLEQVVRSLRTPERVAPVLRELGQRYAPRIEPSTLHAVGRVLRLSLREADPLYSEDLDAAWEHVYGFIAASVRAGMRASSGVASAAASERPPSGQRAKDPSSAGIAKVDGRAVGYRVFGNGPPDVVLTSSSPSTSLASGLARFARVIILDRLESAVPEPHAIEEDIPAVMTDATSSRAIIVVTAEAAAVGIHLASTRPELVDALVLVGAVSPGERESLARVEVPTRVLEPAVVGGNPEDIAGEIERFAAGLGVTALAAVAPS